MAGQSRIVARIQSISSSSSNLDSQAEFIVYYRCTGPVTGQITGEMVLLVDITQSQGAISNDLQSALAAAVTPLVIPPQGYTQSDVRGLNI